MKLLKRKEIIFNPSQPFSFEKTFYNPSHFPSKMEKYSPENRTYYIPLTWNKKIFGIKFSQYGKAIKVSIYSNKNILKKELAEIISELDYRFSITKKYKEFYKKYSTYKFLKSIIKRNRGKHISTNYSLYHHLIVSIFLQNTTIKRTIAMCEAVLRKYGQRIFFDNIELMSLWDLNAFHASENDLRNLKLGYRAKSIIRVTNLFLEMNLNDLSLRKLETKDLVKELLKIYGVGKQTVFYLALSQFQRTEYLKHIPLWERKVISRYVFNKELVDENKIIEWFQYKYEIWCGYALSLIWEDIFHRHKKKPFPWLVKIMKEKIDVKN